MQPSKLNGCTTEFPYAVLFCFMEDGEILVTFPEIPEALTSGYTYHEALENAEDCLAEAIAGRIKAGVGIPIHGRLQQINTTQ